MKIVVFLKSMDGGTGTFALKLLQLAADSRNPMQVRIYCLEEPSHRQISEPVAYMHKASHYPVHYGLSFSAVRCFFREMNWYRRALDNEKADAVLAVDIHANLIALLTRTFFVRREKVIINTRNNLSRVLQEKASGIVGSLLVLAVRFVYGRADAVCAVSGGVRDDLVIRFGISRTVTVISNGIDGRVWGTLHRKAAGKTILSAGRFSPQKDFATLVRAFARVQTLFPESRLHLVGGGPNEDKIRDLVRTLKLSKKVTIHPWSNRIASVYAKADIFVFSSRWEGFPNALLESMAAGLPVVSTDTPYGPSEILEGGRYGLLVPVGREREMARSIGLLLKNEKKYSYYAEKAVERARHFSLERMLGSYRMLILQTLGSDLSASGRPAAAGYGAGRAGKRGGILQ